MRKVFALVVLFTGCFVNECCDGQQLVSGSGSWESVPQLRTSEGLGTGFVVAVSDSEVEIWTASHVAGKSGSAIVVVWQDGTETSGVVARSRLGGSGTTGSDEAKIVARKPTTFDVKPIPIGGDIGDEFVGTFTGYGNNSYIRESETFPTKAQGIANRFQLLPSAIPGDSGGPVFDAEGNVVAVIVQITLNRRREGITTLVIPISRWVDWK